jgi:hypothetical protein
MLFLAVFCGFLAENFREHQVENNREKEFMRSLVEDLQTDTTNLGRIIPFGKEISGRISALVSFLNSESVNDSAGKLYKLNVQVGRVVNVDFEDRTSSQLKNAGNMRLIRNKTVADSIRNYWSDTKSLEDISARLEDVRVKATDISVQLINNKYVHYSDLNNLLSSSITILPGAKLINDDPKLLAQYSNRRQFSLIVLNTYINSMLRLKQTAIRLIETIRKEYHLN